MHSKDGPAFARYKTTSVDPGDELPSHNLAIAFPVFAILDGTPSTWISMGSVETVGDGTHRSKSRVVR